MDIHPYREYVSPSQQNSENHEPRDLYICGSQGIMTSCTSSTESWDVILLVDEAVSISNIQTLFSSRTELPSPTTIATDRSRPRGSDYKVNGPVSFLRNAMKES